MRGKRVQVTHQPQVLVERQPSRQGCYVKARIEGGRDRLPRILVAVVNSREHSVAEAAAWALGWLRELRTENVEFN